MYTFSQEATVVSLFHSSHVIASNSAKHSFAAFLSYTKSPSNDFYTGVFCCRFFHTRKDGNTFAAICTKEPKFHILSIAWISSAAVHSKIRSQNHIVHFAHQIFLSDGAQALNKIVNGSNNLIKVSFIINKCEPNIT